MKMDVTDYVLGGGALGCGWLAWEIFEGPGFFGVDVVWAIPLAIIALILGGLFIHRMAKIGEQRTKKFKDLAEHMGMKFSAKCDSALRESLSLLDLFSKSGVGITNVLHGDSEQLGYGEEFEVTVLEFGHSKTSFSSFVSRRSEYIQQTVICFHSPQLSLPRFSMRPEEWHHKIGSGLGYQDIDFESHPTAAEFSKKYLLRGRGEQKIRALFTDEVLTFFAGQDKLCVEGFSSHLCFYRAEKLIEPEDIPAFMKEGFEVFRLFARKQN
jgi:hypothetical protein